MQPDDFAPGTVWLVGGGPGDPELLTMKAVRLIERADIVFYDALVGDGVLALIPARTTTVCVGKRSGRHSKNQRTIDALLVDAAAAGKRVVRLKGGDPSIFGRSFEELSALREAGYVESIAGPGGGWALCCELTDLTVRDIYAAIAHKGIFAVGPADDNPACPVESAVNRFLEHALSSAQEELLRHFEGMRLSDIARRVKASTRRMPPA